ncbi:hypothetical protein [Mucilaginibacter sp. HD30]
MTVLGISIGTARTGIAVLEDGKILERQAHVYQTTWTENKLRAITDKYREHVRQHNVTAIMVKIPPLSRHSKAVSRLLRGIEAIAKDTYCDFDLITKNEIKDRLCLKSTEEMITYAPMLYPELLPLYKQGLATGHNHYKKIYEAVLAAHIYAQRQKLKQP